jgi:hypothetical protein
VRTPLSRVIAAAPRGVAILCAGDAALVEALATFAYERCAGSQTLLPSVMSTDSSGDQLITA